MLKQVHGKVDTTGATVRLGEAAWPVPFKLGLEYNSPAHGPWNIVHMGMLIPGAQQIYVCAPNCNRGVVLTAAEMNAIDRFSTVFLQEDDFVNGDMEGVIIEGVTDIVQRLSQRPSCILLFTVCVHHFLGTDLPYVYQVLRERFPDLPIVECYMDPIKQKVDRSPDQFLRKAMYTLLPTVPLSAKSISIIGGDFAVDEGCELRLVAAQAGRQVKELPRCTSFAQFLTLSESDTLVYTYPNAKMGAEALAERTGAQLLYLPGSFSFDEIDGQLTALAAALGVQPLDTSELRRKAEAALQHAREIIGATPLALDYTFHPRTLGLARLLLEYGFKVERIYLDAFNGEEQANYAYLKEHYQELMVYATIQVKMREMPRTHQGKVLALGQKAAYFTGTPYFVNLVEGAGLWGYEGICRTVELMLEAFTEEKDGRDLIPRKGLGCACCL